MMLSCLAVLSAPISAASNEEAILWLMAQQGSDGSIVGEADETHSRHATYEAIYALWRHASTHFADHETARQYIYAEAGDPLPFLTRYIQSLLQSETVPASLIIALGEYQHFDGGFGVYPGEKSSVLDTFDALDLFASLETSNPVISQKAISYLLSHQNPDGGFAYTSSSPSSVYLTSRAVQVLRHYRFDYPISNVLQASMDYLWAQQSHASWGETWESAQALLALIPLTTDIHRYANAVEVLRASQQEDGSWEGSVYATALCVRALALAQQQPLLGGSIFGRLRDGESGLPLSGVEVVLSDSVLHTQSKVDGQFELPDIDPGEYIIHYSHTGYASATQELRIEAGQRIDSGTVLLQPLPDIALLQGLISDGTNGHAISGAFIEVVDEYTSVITTTTSDHGAYQLTLSPGNVLISVSAPGYEPVLVSTSIVAGKSIQFSPTLYPVGSEPNDTVNLSGSVMNGVNGSPIANASVLHADGDVVLTSDHGEFSLEGLTAGEITLFVQADGYQSIQLFILASPGSMLALGELPLTPVETPHTSTLSGVVVDEQTGEAIAGALVRIDDRLAYSDPDGRYMVDNIDTLSFGLEISAVGYLGQYLSLGLTAHSTVEMDIRMQRAESEGIAILSLLAEQTAYPAYSQILWTATLQNQTDNMRAVRLYAQLIDTQGNTVDEFVVVPDLAEGYGEYMLLPQSTQEISLSWQNQHYAPGSYRLLFQIHDAESMVLLAEREGVVFITPTARLDHLRLASDITHTRQGSVEDVQLLLTVRNRSNIPFDYSLSYRWLDHEGNILHSDTTALHLEPSIVATTQVLANISEYHFTQAGSYPIEVMDIAGVDVEVSEAGTVTVAPDIRIELEQGIQPESVVPQDDARVRMRIRIEGVIAK